MHMKIPIYPFHALIYRTLSQVDVIHNSRFRPANQNHYLTRKYSKGHALLIPRVHNTRREEIEITTERVIVDEGYLVPAQIVPSTFLSLYPDIYKVDTCSPSKPF